MMCTKTLFDRVFTGRVLKRNAKYSVIVNHNITITTADGRKKPLVVEDELWSGFPWMVLNGEQCTTATPFDTSLLKDDRRYRVVVYSDHTVANLGLVPVMMILRVDD